MLDVGFVVPHRESFAQRLMLVSMAVIYILASQGFMPNPAWLVRALGSATTERYPCEGCGCGCASARECWEHCCCHSTEERLAWAIRNNVRPPADIEFTQEEWSSALKIAEPGRSHCSLCIEKVKTETGHGATEESTPLNPGPAFSALTCKDIQQLLLIAPVIAGAAALADVLPAPRCVGVVPTPMREVCSSRTLEVPKPPPRPMQLQG